MAKYILTIDQGTTGTAVSIFDEKGQIVGQMSHDFPQIYPQPGWVEHHPEDIWRTVVHGIQGVLAQTKVSAFDIAGVGITNQRETVVLWDKKTNAPLYNAIVWQCRRTTSFCNQLQQKKMGKTLLKKTGLVIDPYFSASKIRWLLQNLDSARRKAQQGELAVGTIDTFLLWRLTGGKVHATEPSNASRTQLLNIKSGQWDAELLKLFSIPDLLLPQILPSAGEFGKTQGVPGLPDGIPITGMVGDQQSALFGQGCFSIGLAKCTFGTGSFLLMNTGTKPVFSRSGLLTTIAWQLGQEKTYALEGGAFICGAAVQFLRDQLGFIKESAEIESLAREVESTEGVEFIPALTGMGAPYWNPKSRGMICGMTRGTRRAHIARATLEAMALQNVEILLAMEKDLKKKIKQVRVDGGAAENNLLMQLQADYLGTSILRPKVIESTSAGAAFMAGFGAGLWPNLESLTKIWMSERIFKPQIKLKARQHRLRNWQEAVRRTF